MRKTPRGWIQIGESRTRGVARIPLGLKPLQDSRATSQRDSPIWIQPLGVFRYITPLGRARAIYKCNIECRLGILIRNGQMILEVKGNGSHVRYQQIQIYWLKLKSITSFCVDKPDFLEFWSKWPWRLMSMTPIFNTRQDYPRMRVWCKFGDFGTNLWWAIVRITLISNNSWSKWPKGQGQWPPFSVPAESILYMMHLCCEFGDSGSKVWRVMVQTTQIS